MANIREKRNELVRRILEGEGKAAPSDREAAFNGSGGTEPLRRLVGGITAHAGRIADGDIAAARRSGLTEDQIFEIVVCAAVGQSNRNYEVALAALAQAKGAE